ncbi:hypothetical protein RvY_16920 [Ramazzottius varieornatus]|uniref:Uncharacterized protein n=1 Tax=Ramazzottius varieornatus TaxID=947166 RepID=A0A1D1W088_RAMVA|nr:hypothetical protein RvY_16920 [Ramazzottius varieornatus]
MVKGVGFVMFGKKHFESFLEHVHKFAAQQKSTAGGKLTNVPTTEAQFKGKFTAALDNRLKSIDKNSIITVREDEDL